LANLVEITTSCAAAAAEEFKNFWRQPVWSRAAEEGQKG
jgi:hypothetical protein